MKKYIVFLLMTALVFVALPSFAAQGGEKGASAKAYENASDEAIFHRVGDWFATIGKSDEEKAAIKAERRAKRETARAQKELQKQKREMERQGKELEKIGKQMKGDAGKKMKGLGKQ